MNDSNPWNNEAIIQMRENSVNLGASEAAAAYMAIMMLEVRKYYEDMISWIMQAKPLEHAHDWELASEVVPGKSIDVRCVLCGKIVFGVDEATYKSLVINERCHVDRAGDELEKAQGWR